ncbi:hypothetical protein IQ279_03760 [Streptomyces verrucosisporus]|uniref:hypothetical protein n=1 Tax=Streptomyces verrucosisporus TaxID=1695161 RepID=UPI0019D09634|nr:hypothetical protein [Streptomyces verrucosisporus]MBN3928767.1 hypothetical protein [Streptomyces verrucosisporus]
MAALAVVTAVIAYSMRDDEHLKANRAQVRKACAGLLPAAHLDPFLPRDSAVTHGQYGTLLEPGHESRAFIDCRLDWAGDGGVHMRAEPWGPGDVLPPAEDGDVLPLPYRLPDGSRGAVTAHDMYGDTTQVGVVLRVACPKGDFERFRLGTDVKVSVELPVRVRDEDDDGYTDGPVEEELRLVVRSAVHAADRVREHQACGTTPFGKLSPAPASERDGGDGGGGDGDEETGTEDERGDVPRGKGTCAWLNPAAMGYPKGKWRVSGGSSFDPARGKCRAAFDGHPEENEIKGVDAISVSGAGARSFYQGDETGLNDHEADEYHEPGPGWTAVPKRTAELLPSDDHTLPSLSLWAESVCDGGQTFHRISVTPELGYHLDPDGEVTRHEEDGPAPSRVAREELSRTARAALDRYLGAPGGWPERAHCRDTKVLGEVEEWRSIDDE